MYSLCKSVLILVTLLLLSLSYGAFVWAQPFGILSQQGQKESQKQVLSSPVGRFVFGQISDSSKDQFMLDTLTGRLWRISERGDIGMFLTSVPYCSSDGKCTALPEETTHSEQGKNGRP